MVSIRDVAQEADVSVTTVSLVLNNKGNISEITRTRVMQAVETLGYKRSFRAQNLRNQQSRIIGYASKSQSVAYNFVLSEFLAHLVQGVERYQRHLLLFSNPVTSSTDVYRRLIETDVVDGFVLSFTEENDERFEFLHNESIPFVAFGRSLSPYDNLVHWVDVDGKDGMYQATQHLIEQGHERIGFIGWPPGSASGDARFQGYLKALNEANLSPNEAWVIRAEDAIDTGYNATHELLQNAPNLTAIVAISDMLAVGALRYFNAAGKRLAVTGFDDNPISRSTHPTLTTVRQPIIEIAERVTELLDDQLSGRTPKQQTYLLLPKLIIRNSSIGT